MWVFSIGPHYIHTFLAPTVGQRKFIFLASCCTFRHFEVCCPYDSVQVQNLRAKLFIFARGWRIVARAFFLYRVKLNLCARIAAWIFFLRAGRDKTSRGLKTFSRRLSEFRANCKSSSRETLRQQLLFLAYSLIFLAANHSPVYLLVFSGFFWNSIATGCNTAHPHGETSILLSKLLSCTHHGLSALIFIHISEQVVRQLEGLAKLLRQGKHLLSALRRNPGILLWTDNISLWNPKMNLLRVWLVWFISVFIL